MNGTTGVGVYVATTTVIVGVVIAVVALLVVWLIARATSFPPL